MKKKTYKIDRNFYVMVYNKVQTGTPYPALAKQLDIPLIQAFGIFNAAMNAVSKSGKLKLIAFACRTSYHDWGADAAIKALGNHGIDTYSEFARFAKDVEAAKKEIRSWTDTTQPVKAIILQMASGVTWEG